MRVLKALDPRLRGDDGVDGYIAQQTDLDPRLRGDDELFAFIVIPAQAGIQFVELSLV